MDVNRTISPNDKMFNECDRDGYFLFGESALHHICRALAITDASPPREILDMPCGHGRVLRTLQAAFPEAQLTACDIDRDGVDFCIQNFSARGVYSVPNPTELRFDTRFDLIWVGSLFTHLGVSAWTQFLPFFTDRLVVGGLLVFTTHGRHYANSFQANEHLPHFRMDPQSRVEMLADYQHRGFGYQDYPGTPGYGLSISAPTWVMATLAQYAGQLRLVSYTERAWRGLHDIVTCQRGYKRRLLSDAP